MLHFLKTYLLCAIAICVICTFVITYNCSCANVETTVNKQQLNHFGDIPRNEELKDTYLLISIMSSPTEASVRDVIRNTWLRLSSKGASVFQHFFPVGIKGQNETILKSLEMEKEKYGDVVLIDDLEESYSNLARKTLRSMEYAYRNYKFKHLLKVDSDSFVRVGAVLKSVKDIDHPRLYWGFLDGRAKPIRKGKWKEPNWMLCDRYLPYQLGGGYVLAYELVRFLSINSRLLKMYTSEDVSVGAWLAGLDIKYVHDPRFDTEWTSRGCHNEYLITHKKKPHELEQLFDNLANRKFLCEKEYRTRWSYVYDWAAVPSECCKRMNGSSIP